MTGYDFDGVWTAGVRPQPGENYVIITGSLWNDWPRVRGVLAAESGPMPGPVYMRPNGMYGHRESAGQWKADMIRVLGVTLFYEDDPVQATIIKKHVPTCRVILVGNGGKLEVI